MMMYNPDAINTILPTEQKHEKYLKYFVSLVGKRTNNGMKQRGNYKIVVRKKSVRWKII